MKVTQALQCPSHAPVAYASEPFNEESLEEPLRRRCGRPYTRSFRSLISTFFLPNLLAADKDCEQPSTLFVQADFIRAFLGDDQDSAEALSNVQDLSIAASFLAAQDSGHPVENRSLSTALNAPAQSVPDSLSIPTSIIMQGCQVEAIVSSPRREGPYPRIINTADQPRPARLTREPPVTINKANQSHLASLLREARRAGWMEGLRRPRAAGGQDRVSKPRQGHQTSRDLSLPYSRRSSRSLISPCDIINSSRLRYSQLTGLRARQSSHRGGPARSTGVRLWLST